MALVLIDVINDFQFPDDDKILKNALPMADHLAKLKQRCRRAGIPAIYVNDNFGQWRSDAKSLVSSCLASRSASSHAKENGCFFEINSSPDRLDLSAENARIANEAGVRIAISTDAHSKRDFGTLRYGIDQARRAGLEPASILNCLPWPSLEPLFRR